MKKIKLNNLELFFLILLLITIFTSYSLGNLFSKFLGDDFNLKNLQINKPQNRIHSLDEFGYVNIFNLTMDKKTAEIGENVTVSTFYSFVCNPGYERGCGYIGIERFGGFNFIDSRDSLITGVYNIISETFSLDPNKYKAADIYQGKVEIAIIDTDNPAFPVITYQNLTSENLTIAKAKLNYSIIEQNPLTIFSKDTVYFSLFICNEHTKKFHFSDNSVEIVVFNEKNSLNFSKKTDSAGFLNFTVDCSLLEAGIYTISLINDETADYESCNYSFQMKVYDENLSINCSLLNNDSIYASVNYDNSNYTKAIYSIECEFEANINYSSSFCSGECLRVGNQYIAAISTPIEAGMYQIQFISQPILRGRAIKFEKTLRVDKRPIKLDPFFFRYENKSLLYIQVNIVDRLINHLINKINDITIFVKYNSSTRNIGIVQCNTSGIALLEWVIPNKIIENYIKFTFLFNETVTYQFQELIRNMTITNLKYLGPIQWISGKNLTITAKLCALNGTMLPNQLVYVKINRNLINLVTNENGEISYTFITPSYPTILELEIFFTGTNQILSANLKFYIGLKLDLLHQIWNSSGYILVSISLAVISIIYLKKKFFRNNLSTLSVD